MQDIPLIDISPLSSADSSARRAVSAQIGSACREVGFFVITGHGVAAERVAATFAASARFFAQPGEIKRRMAIGELGGNRGYVGLGIEKLDERLQPITRRPSTSSGPTAARGPTTPGLRCPGSAMSCSATSTACWRSGGPCTRRSRWT
jgi:isopenicillin N synthase-like dioxygenase